MYAPEIVARRIANYESHYGVRLREVPIQRARELVNYLEGHPDPARPRLHIRPAITPEFRAFIENELAMCKASFLYFAKRYCWLQLAVGEGAFGLFEPWESQLLLLAKIAKTELHMWAVRDDYAKRGYDVRKLNYDAICYFIHKARQLGFTLLVQLLLLHRAIFYSDTRTISVSLNDQMTQDVHKRWTDAYTRLPWWMRTSIHSTDKEYGKVLVNGSKVTLQDFSQESGLGQGEQWDCAHLTELASIPDHQFSIAVVNHFLPTVARTMRGLCMFESTSQGIGNAWHRATEQARRGEFSRFGYCYIPWYAERTKNARYDFPPDWKPDKDTLAHAHKVKLTSPEWMGYEYELTKEQMYFYETERETARKLGEYRTFLTNFCATPEESFQHSGASAFNSEILDILSNKIEDEPIAYELADPHVDMTRRRIDKGNLVVGQRELVPVYMSERDRSDPRGLILLFDRPRLDVMYSVGGDPTEGIAGWHRVTRTSADEELRVDNAALSIWYVDPLNGRSKQAAEFAAPITPRPFADYCKTLCHLFHGLHGMEQGAPLILEIYPGPGGQTQARLQYELQFYNFYRWRVFDGMTIKQTNSWGWVSNSKSVRELWIKTREMVEDREQLPVLPQSRYLLYEMNYATWDRTLMRGRAMEGFHDDRVSAAMFSLWQLHDWSTPRLEAPKKANIDKSKCKPDCTEEKHNYYCPNLPEEKWDWQERASIASFDDYSQAVDSWMDGVTRRY